MAKRHTRVKLSRAQKLENERNRWLAKKAAAIDMLVKAMDKLKSLDRSYARMQRTAQLPIAAVSAPPQLEPPAEHPQVEAEAVANALIDGISVPPKRVRKPKAAPGGTVAGLTAQDERAARMRAMGFRSTSKRANKPAGH